MESKHNLEKENQGVEQISIKLPKMLDFLDAIENIESRSTILAMLSERLLEDGIVSYRYDSLKMSLPNTRFKNLINSTVVTGETYLQDIFNKVSLIELSRPSVLESQDSEGSFLIFPTFGPYIRGGIFILHSPAREKDHLPRDIRILDMVLQKTHVFISALEAEKEEEYLALTEREIDVLACISSGLNNQESADILGISIHTINGYLRRIMLKYGTSDKLNTGLAGLSTPQIISRARKLILKSSRII